VVIDQPDQMKPVSHELRLREVFSPQRGFAALGGQVVDRVIFQVAEGGRVAELASEEVLVDAQNLWTRRGFSFRRPEPQIILEPAFDGGAGDRFPLERKILYITQAGVRPPSFIVFTDKAGPLHFSHERYLVNQLRKRFGFAGIPIELKIRGRVKRSERKPLR
jgi:hypothetical protein